MTNVLNPTLLWNELWGALRGSRQGVKDVIVSAVPQLVGVFTRFFGSALIARGLGPTGMGMICPRHEFCGYLHTPIGPRHRTDGHSFRLMCCSELGYASLEEIAQHIGFIDDNQIVRIAANSNNAYPNYLKELL